MTNRSLAMSVPNEPLPDQPPMPPPGLPPSVPVKEPEPDRLPDEVPLPNPDENDEPPQHVECSRLRRIAILSAGFAAIDLGWRL
jgi:hypothetical protein